MPISKIDFFEPRIWKEDALLREIERNLAEPDDLLASGQWKAALPPGVSKKLGDLLAGGKGRAVTGFDPAGYLAELGLPQSLTAGRTNSDVLRAFHLIKTYRPDPRYFPFSGKIGARLQGGMLAISRISPALVSAIDRLVDPLAVHMTAKKCRAAHYRSAPYGKFEEIVKGARSDLSREDRYLGILRRQVPQFAWDRGPHIGSIAAGERAEENFGTYDIAVKFGFSETQARRISLKCYDVDISRTHYHDPRDQNKQRITGTVGEIGDIQRHYNRSPAGTEDSRITAARIHLERAIRLANEGFYDAAEQEVGIGLHSLQDIFSHAQLTPSIHTCLGEFPDLVKYHPLAMFETALATEGYFKKFVAGLNLKPLAVANEHHGTIPVADPFIGGTAAPEERARVSQQIAGFPQRLTACLRDNGIRIYVGAAETLLTEIGFGVDLDGDGRITPGNWVDVNRDGEKQWFEVEDQFDIAETWDRQKAAYNHLNRTIFISASTLKDPGLQKIIKHEINHAMDSILQEDPRLNTRWIAYLTKFYNAARRRAAIAFDELDPHEVFAGIGLP